MLKLTGERVIPDLMQPTNGMLLEHLARYYFALPYVHGRVLDIACGVGYGTFMVAKSCNKTISEIIGVDLDPETINYAKKRYNQHKTSYFVENVVDPSLPERLGLFETIVSFETIEHLPDENVFIENLYKMLKPGGKLIISTPFGQGKGLPTNEPFHFHQFTKEEFISAFNIFSQVDIFFQRGVTFEYSKDGELPREGIHYPLGVLVCEK